MCTIHRRIYLFSVPAETRHFSQHADAIAGRYKFFCASPDSAKKFNRGQEREVAVAGNVCMYIRIRKKEVEPERGGFYGRT